MHSFGFRFNALVTFAVTILAVVCALTSFSDNFNAPSPTADVKVLNINWFQKQPNGNEEVSIALNISADLQSLFTWNTKQVFVFVAAEYETPQNALNEVADFGLAKLSSGNYNMSLLMSWAPLVDYRKEANHLMLIEEMARGNT